MEGYIYSAGKTEGGVPFYKAPDYYILNGQSHSMEHDLSTSPINKSRLPIVPCKDGFLMAGSRGGELGIDKYKRTKGKGKNKLDYTVSKSWTFPSVGVGRVSNMKELQNGDVLCAWYDESLGDAVRYPRFSFFNGKKWKTVESSFHNLSMGMPFVTADFAQDSNGVIWYFAQGDSNKNVCLIQLVERDIVYMDTEFLFDGDEFQAWGESPCIIAEPYQDGIILAYHSVEGKLFSSSPHLRGAKINVIKVNQDRTKEWLYQTDDYAERTIPFALMGTSIIYAPIDEDTLLYNKMYLYDGDNKTFLVESMYPMKFRYTDIHYFCNGMDGEIAVLFI